MKKTIIFVLIFALLISTAEAIIYDKTDLKNLSGPQEYQSWDWGNITAFVDHLNNVTRVGYGWLCQYTGENSIPGCWTHSNAGTSATTPFFGGNKIYLDGSDYVRVASPSNKFYICGYRQQLSAANTYFELDNGACTDNFLGFAKEDVNNRGSKNANCGSFNTYLPASNTSEYLSICIDSIFGIAYISDGRGSNTFTNTADLTYSYFNFQHTGGTSGAMGYFRGYDPTSAENSSANRWQKKIRINGPNSSFSLIVYASEGDSANYELFVSCNNGSSYVNTTTNGSTINCPNSQLSQDIIYGFTFGSNVNITRIDLQSGSAASDTTPVEITFYNLTVGAGCTNWNTDKNNPCNTSDLTPTVSFNTSENAWCSIGASNLNYTNMTSSRNCDGGEGTLKHSCELKSQDQLVYEDSYIYISCRDANYNENSTSTSGALRVNATDLESVSKDSIETGIRNALISNYALYTDQKVYARNSANNQAVGRFDKVVKKLNQIWAINRIGAYESFVNMFNITPTLYTLEITNKTSVQIINETELLINSTK